MLRLGASVIVGMYWCEGEGILEQTLLLGCIIGVLIFCCIQGKKCKKLENEIQRMADSMSHFMLYGEEKQRETLEEGVLANLQNEIFKMEELFSYQRERHKLEEKRLNQFMENMAHQMKTILTSLQIRVDSAQVYAVTEQEKYALMRSQECISRMDGELERILNCSQIASGKAAMHFQRTGIHTLIKRCIENLKPFAEKKEVVISVTGSPGLEFGIDEYWMEQAFENIIKNALEHTVQKSEIIINVLDDGNEVQIKIEDDGEGIEELELPYIFERFHRGNSTKTGYGIGLSMAADIVKAHHGKLSAGNRAKGGAWFLISLPVLEGAKAYKIERPDEREM